MSDAGTGKIDRAALMRPFLEQGGKSTLNAWIAANLKVGVAVKAAARLDRRATAARGRGKPGAVEAAKVAPAGVVTARPCGVAPRDAMALALPLPRGELDHALSPGQGLRVSDRLDKALNDIEKISRYAFHEDGRVRNAKLSLSAAGHMRACLETAVKLTQAMQTVEQTDRFQSALLDEVDRLAPGLQERVLVRITQITTE